MNSFNVMECEEKVHIPQQVYYLAPAGFWINDASDSCIVTQNMYMYMILWP